MNLTNPPDRVPDHLDPGCALTSARHTIEITIIPNPMAVANTNGVAISERPMRRNTMARSAERAVAVHSVRMIAVIDVCISLHTANHRSSRVIEPRCRRPLGTGPKGRQVQGVQRLLASTLEQLPRLSLRLPGAVWSDRTAKIVGGGPDYCNTCATSAVLSGSQPRLPRPDGVRIAGFF